MRRIAICLLTSLCVITTAFAQKNFEPGTIILNSGQTVNGFIDNRKWLRNPTSIDFRETETSVPKNYLLNELKGFTIGNNESYVRTIVPVDNNSLDMNVIQPYDPALTTKDTVWLRQLVKGPLINIFEYNNRRPHYYMQQEDGLIYELIYKLDASVSPPQLVYVFRNQLLGALAEKSLSSKAKYAIKSAEYGAESMFRIGMAVNGDQSSTEVGGGPKKQTARYFIGAGIRMSNFKFTSPNNKLNSLNFSSSNISPVLTAGVDLIPLRGLHALLFRPELSLSQRKIEGKGVTKSTAYTYDNEYHLTQNNITPSFSLLYNIVSTKKVKLNFGVGVGINISSYPKNEFISNYGGGFRDVIKDYPEVRKIWYGEYLRGGFLFSDHIEVSAIYQFSGSIYNEATAARNDKPIFLKVAYIF